jgi:hypothetical protein
VNLRQYILLAGVSVFICGCLKDKSRAIQVKGQLFNKDSTVIDNTTIVLSQYQIYNHNKVYEYSSTYVTDDSGNLDAKFKIDKTRTVYICLPGGTGKAYERAIFQFEADPINYITDIGKVYTDVQL